MHHSKVPNSNTPWYHSESSNWVLITDQSVEVVRAQKAGKTEIADMEDCPTQSGIASYRADLHGTASC